MNKKNKVPFIRFRAGIPAVRAAIPGWRMLDVVGPTGAATCASCRSDDDLTFLDPSSDVAFCADCLTPMSALDFPMYYCDIGGEA